MNAYNYKAYITLYLTTGDVGNWFKLYIYEWKHKTVNNVPMALHQPGAKMKWGSLDKIEQQKWPKGLHSLSIRHGHSNKQQWEKSHSIDAHILTITHGSRVTEKERNKAETEGKTVKDKTRKNRKSQDKDEKAWDKVRKFSLNLWSSLFLCVCVCVCGCCFFFFLLMSLFHAQGDMGRYYEQLVEHVLTSDESGQKAYVL